MVSHCSHPTQHVKLRPYRHVIVVVYLPRKCLSDSFGYSMQNRSTKILYSDNSNIHQYLGIYRNNLIKKYRNNLITRREGILYCNISSRSRNEIHFGNFSPLYRSIVVMYWTEVDERNKTENRKYSTAIYVAYDTFYLKMFE
jgi:hypothetical protein